MNIYIGNLDFMVSENDLTRAFEKFGAVSSVKIITDKYSGRSKGFGFVTMEDNSEASEAINTLNGTNLKNRDMTVTEAKPKKESFFK
jgi:RNA recognition motif-containing protein